MSIDIATARELAQQTMIATSALLASATAPGAPPLPPEVMLALTTAERHACLAWAALYRAHGASDPAAAARQAEGRAFAAALAPVCTGVTARWCPVHGDCACPPDGDDMDTPGCPLHDPASAHGEEP